MPDFLTRRNGTWHFVRRVPVEFAALAADTGLRLSEAVNLQRHSIHLDAPIPYVEVLPDARRLKTEDSRREIPLVSEAPV